MNKIAKYFTILINNPTVLLIGLIFCGIGLCLLCLFLGRQIGRSEMNRHIKTQRQDAIKRSKAVVTGQIYEQLAPLLPDFPCNPKEVQFIGKPIDFIGFCGSEENDLVKEILFIEVKTGGSSLSPREKSVKEAVLNKKIRYVEFRPEI